MMFIDCVVKSMSPMNLTKLEYGQKQRWPHHTMALDKMTVWSFVGQLQLTERRPNGMVTKWKVKGTRDGPTLWFYWCKWTHFVAIA